MNRTGMVLGIVLLVGTIGPAVASTNLQPVTYDCVFEAAEANDVPANAVFTILAAEGGKVGSIVRHTQYDHVPVDYGPMQLNERWVDRFVRMGFDEKRIYKNGCLNVKLGTWILGREFKRARIKYRTKRKVFWYAIGNYHSRTKHLRKQYVNHALRSIESMNTDAILRRVNARVDTS